MDQKPEKQQTFWEKWQDFSEKHYAPYVAWWFSWKTNVISALIVMCGLGLFYLYSKP